MRDESDQTIQHAAAEQAHREAVEYMRSMLTELGAIARREKLDMLAYLIGMAAVEAADVLAREAARSWRRQS